MTRTPTARGESQPDDAPAASGSEPTGRAGFATLMAAHDDRLSNCVHCGFCLPACPTYTRLGDEADSPRGRLHLMRAVAEGRLDPGSSAFQTHIDRCLGCRACETVCPSGVEYGFLLERARDVAGRAEKPGLATRLLLAMISSPPLLAAWMAMGRLLRASRMPGFLARVTPARGFLKGLPLAMGMLEASRGWRPPRPSPQPPSPDSPSRGAASAGSTDGATSRRPWRSTASASAHPTDAPTHGGALAREPRVGDRVGILAGCVQAHLFARVNEATRRVLEVNGFEVVEVERQGCCGALHAHAGRLDAARSMASHNASAFRAGSVDWIAANAAGCGATMKEYGDLVGDAEGADSDAAWFASRVRDVSELLVGEGRVPRPGAPLPVRVVYDPPCHLLHGQGVDSQPVDLLGAIPGLEVVRVANGEECCGGAGIYGLTHPDLGGRIGRDKVAAVLDTKADLVATGNPGCAMQIGGQLAMEGSDVRVVHPIELLDASYRRAGLYEPRARRDNRGTSGASASAAGSPR